MVPPTAPASLRLAGAALIAMIAGTASAQDSCQSPYTIESGDTLSAIAVRCGTTVDELLDANPSIEDANAIRIGASLAIPGSAAAAEEPPEAAAAEPAGEEVEPRGDTAAARQPAQPRERPARPTDDTAAQPAPPDLAARPTTDAPVEATDEGVPGRQITVQPGDTLETIAERTGSSTAALAAANPDLATGELTPGDTLTIPAGLPGARTVTASPAQAAPGTAVTVTAEGFLPGSSVVIGGGPPGEQWQHLASARTGPDGSVVADVTVPQDYAPGRAIVFVVEGPLDDLGRSDPVTVVRGEPPADLAGAAAGDGGVDDAAAGDGGVDDPAAGDGGMDDAAADDGGVDDAAADDGGMDDAMRTEEAIMDEAPLDEGAGRDEAPRGEAGAMRAAAREEAPTADDAAAGEPATTGTAAAAGGAAVDGDSDILTVEGELAPGVECPIIRTGRGAVYSLIGGIGTFGPGARVRVQGPIVDMTFCMEGEATIRISSIEAAR